MEEHRQRGTRPPLVAAAHLAALVALGAVAPAAGEWQVRIDPEATAVRFTLGATLHTVRGTAAFAAGPQELTVDPQTGAVAGRLVVDAASLDTGNDRRDRKLHGEVLESATYPEIEFVAERIDGLPQAGAGATAVEISGRLEIHGGAHPLTVRAAVALDGERLTGTARFEVPYVAWGMRDPSKALLRVAKVVEVAVDLAATLAKRD